MCDIADDLKIWATTLLLLIALHLLLLTGFAYIGTTCYTDGRSVSVVEDHGGFQSESTATHELGHR